MMTCRECIEYMEQYQKGKLPNDVRQLVDEHLDQCSSCAAAYRTEEGVERFVASQKAVEPNPFIATRVMARIAKMDATPSKSKTVGLRPAFFAISIAASIVLGVIAGSLYQHGHTHTQGGNDMAYINDASLESIDLLTSE